MTDPLRILIGCATSCVALNAFLARGHDAWQCDLLPADEPTNRHIQGDVRDHLADGWDMSAKAGAVNGLTTEMLLAGGNPVSQVLDFYEACIRDGYHMAAYNAQFDGKMMRGEYRRAGRDDLFEITPFVRYPKRDRPQWPARCSWL